MRLQQASTFPSIPNDSVFFPPEEQFGSRGGTAHVQVDGGNLWEVVARLGSITGDAEHQVTDEMTSFALWTAWGTLRDAAAAADGVRTLLLAYSALEGLILDVGEDRSRLGPRAAWLVGSSISDRRAIRSLVPRLDSLRGFVAHGRRPRSEDIASAFGVYVQDDDFWAKTPSGSNDLLAKLRATILELARRSFLGVLWLAVQAERSGEWPSPPKLTPGLSRRSIIDLIERAERNDHSDQAQLDEALPAFTRGTIP